jgi:hypothetical protein
LDDFKKLIEVNGLLDEAVGMEVIAILYIARGAGGSEDHDGDTPELLVIFDDAQHLPTVPLGKVEVHKYQVRGRLLNIRALLAQKFDGFNPVVYDLKIDLPGTFTEGFLCKANVARVVFYEQNVVQAIVYI